VGTHSKEVAAYIKRVFTEVHAQEHTAETKHANGRGDVKTQVDLGRPVTNNLDMSSPVWPTGFEEGQAEVYDFHPEGLTGVVYQHYILSLQVGVNHTDDFQCF